VKVNLHIERLIVDGVELTHRERRELMATVQDELRSLLATRHERGGSTSSARQVTSGATANRAGQLGREVALGIEHAMTARAVPTDGSVTRLRTESTP
jgi:hypothetical protein